MTGENKLQIPVVDFRTCAVSSELKPETEVRKTEEVRNTEEVRKTEDLVTEGLEKSGCVYLTNHGVDMDDLENMREIARQFFALPDEVKMKSIRTEHDPKNGWVAQKMEYFTNDKTAPDLKECYNIALPDVDRFSWPGDELIPGFREAHRHIMVQLNQLVRRCFTILGNKYSPQDPTIFTRAFKDLETVASDNNFTCVRNLYYPPLSHYPDKELRAGRVRCSEHTDFGIFTFLLQDMTGGLEVKSREGQWFPAPPLEGAILLQAGDMIERWTAGRIKATVHRVRNPADTDTARECTTYFVHPDSDFLVSCLDGSHTYAPVTTREYIAEKIRLLQASDEENMKMIQGK